MVLGVVGISYREAALKERERAIQYLKSFEENLFLAQNCLGPRGAFVSLLTCHRAELYYYSASPQIAQAALLSEFTSCGVRPYCHRGMSCFSHLFCVTSGLDSLIFGETEIQGQVKRAYLKTAKQRSLPFDLHFLFQKALKEGKDYRSQTIFPRNEVTIETVIRESLLIYGKSVDANLLFVGYSDINRKVAGSLYQNGYYNITFCSRQKVTSPYLTLPREALSFRQSYDVIFFGSSEPASQFLDLSYQTLASVPHRIIFDFNVPRTFLWKEPPKDFIYLDMDFISEYMQKRLPCSEKEANKAKFFLTCAAKKQWEIYEKKSSHISQRQISTSCVHSVLSY
ncbi:Glutamyl-tRNA reductase,glutamyl-tRNA reductase,Glutamyl-tRNA reductase,glutamyl-tRNA reductase,Glutamyl-tRNAGlu reductase, N-terminal domain [Chlamydia serpentis]|uniref:Glutamyl-tRNA reductase n=1 Tax=Chlamydia serpentis TaxID=1967782 RepID=A0A2R8FBY8_9CHLA|nr:glutamyl-tRNA reductase [Chlamydia serpentis]SPN73832.1 Glutamyl-tRNA reductase,glutamyl-tRNA reductase,Glutamyl-tRNA reductase,glutamyl-tRNA reductase,Glutamyl-tRNAGlu reductase, N-terminal domain [Chlamydia serpentis]